MFSPRCPTCGPHSYKPYSGSSSWIPQNLPAVSLFSLIWFRAMLPQRHSRQQKSCGNLESPLKANASYHIRQLPLVWRITDVYRATRGTVAGSFCSEFLKLSGCRKPIRVQKTIIQSMQATQEPFKFAPPKQPIYWQKALLWQSLGFLIIIVLTWCNSIFDLTHYILGMQRQDEDINQTLISTVVIVFLWMLSGYMTAYFTLSWLS